MLCVCVGDVMDVVFSVCNVRRGAVDAHENISHSITTKDPSKRWMKKALFSKHRNAVKPMMITDNRNQFFSGERPRLR